MAHLFRNRPLSAKPTLRSYNHPELILDHLGAFYPERSILHERVSFAPVSVVLVLAALFALIICSAAGNAQEKKAQVAAPGDTLTTPGPLAQNLSPKLDKRDLAKAMKLVADWQLSRMPAHAQYDWTWAALYDGFMAVPKHVAGDKYRRAMLQVGEQLKWQPGPRRAACRRSGRGPDVHGAVLPAQRPEHDGPCGAARPEMAAPDPISSTLPHTGTRKTPLWWWCDALFMAPPVYADMAAATGDQKYLDVHGPRVGCDDRPALRPLEASLLARCDVPRQAREERREDVLVARQRLGDGRNCARAEKLPADSPLRPKYVALLKEMAAEMVSIQGNDGLWRPGLLDADAYPLPEISGSAFITYALAYGVNEGILDRATYWPAVEKAWAGMMSHVYADGRLGCIQPVGAAPGAYTETSSYVYGVGAWLLAAEEIERRAK